LRILAPGIYVNHYGEAQLRNTKFLVFSLVIGIGAIGLVVPVVPGAVNQLAHAPAALFWLGLAIAVIILPVRGVAGIGALNISPLPLLTMLLVHGTGVAIVGGWVVGIIATLSSRTGSNMADIERALVNSAKHALCLLASGLVLWGSKFNIGGLSEGLGQDVFLRLLAAHVVYFGVSTSTLASAVWLRDGTNPFEVWKANFGWGALVSWSTPLGAYLLALFYLQGGFLLIGILVGIGLIGILTVRDHVRIRSSFIHLIDALGLARDGNMPHLKGETHRIVELAVQLGHRMHLPYRSMQLVEQGAMLHNVGYIAVDRDTVRKPSLLTDREMGEIREHPESGMRILNEVAGMGSVADIVRSHHESPDGTGYPDGLKVGRIPIESAIIKVAEAFVAITSPRPHRLRVRSKDGALEEISKVAGRTLDPTVAYYLFEMMGRADLAAKVSKGFGPPSRQQIRRRLYKPKSESLRILPTKAKEKRSMLIGACMVFAAVCVLSLSVHFGFSLTLGSPTPWLLAGASGGLFFLFLLGLAALKPVRLPWGAYVSSASAIVLVMSLGGGPAYATIFSFALIGWAMLLDPAHALSSSAKMMNGITSNSNGSSRNFKSRGAHRQRAEATRSKGNGGITSLIKTKALGSKLSTAAAYGYVLMLSGSGAWAAYRLGSYLSGSLGLSGTAYQLFPFFLAVSVYYLAETSLQSALLSRNGLSPFRLWQRNYLKIFPEPLTYAICGYAILLGTNLLGLWAAIPLFLFPTLWRHLALLRRLELLKSKESLIRAVARAVDEKDRYTGGHSASVVEIGVAIAREMGKAEPFVEQVEEAAIRHDLGKVSWPNQVLRKPTRLEGEEEEYKWTHPDVSAEIAAHAGSSKEVVEMIKYHHERYDGRGYPEGLKGEEIPLGARILCVADSFDAMIHDRWYKRKRTIEGAVEEVRRCSGTQFAPEVVDAFIRILEKMDLEKLIVAVENVVGEIEETDTTKSDEELVLTNRQNH
jgi:HD-GYP domain-containing protein (c-di-GMP phosphodiesterase class II)